MKSQVKTMSQSNNLNMNDGTWQVLEKFLLSMLYIVKYISVAKVIWLRTMSQRREFLDQV